MIEGQNRSLSGLTVAVTASRRASEMAHLIASFGGEPYIAPTVAIESNRGSAIGEVRRFVSILLDGGVDYAVFLTSPGVHSLVTTAETLGLRKQLIEGLGRVKVVARSPKPQKILNDYGLAVDAIPSENTLEGIAELFRTLPVSGKRIAILWHGSSSPALVLELQRLNAQVYEFSTYSYSMELNRNGAQILESMGFKYASPHEEKVIRLIEDVNACRIDVITFTSPPAVSNLFKIADSHSMRDSLSASLNERVLVAAVGSSTQRVLEENGVGVDVVPATYRMGAMISALNRYVSRNGARKERSAVRGRRSESRVG